MLKSMFDQSFEAQNDHKRNMAKILRGQKQKTRAKFGETSIPPSTLPKLLSDNTLQQIEETTSGKIYVRDDGVIKLFAPSIEQYTALEDAITSAAGSHLVPGRVYTAQVATIKDFGAFVTLPGSDIQALLHISEISPERIASVEDELSPGEEIQVKYLGRDHLGNLRVSKKQAYHD
jgi:polyribonucleotide nucleotidyltransferase